MQSEPIDEKVINEGLRVRVFVDDSPLDPRDEFDQLGTMVMPDTANRSRVEEGDLVSVLKDAFNRGGYELAIRYLNACHNAVAIQTDGDGVLYVTRDKVNAEWRGNGFPMPSDEAIRNLLNDEWNEYLAWCEGDVYGYVVERIVTVHSASGDVCHYGDWEEVESCWGFYGDSDYTMQEGIKAAESL